MPRLRAKETEARFHRIAVLPGIWWAPRTASTTPKPPKKRPGETPVKFRRYKGTGAVFPGPARRVDPVVQNDTYYGWRVYGRLHCRRTGYKAGPLHPGLPHHYPGCHNPATHDPARRWISGRISEICGRIICTRVYPSPANRCCRRRPFCFGPPYKGKGRHCGFVYGLYLRETTSQKR